LGFANYFTRKDESIYDTFNLIVGRNAIIVMFFFILVTILILLGFNPFYFLEGKEKLERMGIIFVVYLITLPIFMIIFPSNEIMAVEMEEKELKYYYILNAIILFSLLIIFALVTFMKKGFI
jgi:hypothetical protein